MMLKKAREKYGTTADDVPQSSGRAPAEQSRDWECSICTSSNQTKVSLGCGHVMCDHCAIRSIENQQKCPFCQRAASEEDIRRIFWQILMVSYYSAEKSQKSLNFLRLSIWFSFWRQTWSTTYDVINDVTDENHQTWANNKKRNTIKKGTTLQQPFYSFSRIDFSLKMPKMIVIDGFLFGIWVIL